MVLHACLDQARCTPPARGQPRCPPRPAARAGVRSAVEAVRVGGHISLIGVLTGLAGEVPTAALMAKQARLQGLIVGSRRQQQDYVAALDHAEIRPVIDRTFGFDALPDAFRHQEAGAHFGKICAAW